MDATHDVGVVDGLAAAAWWAEREVADGDAAGDVLVAWKRASLDEAAHAAVNLANGAPRAVEPALGLLENAAFVGLLAACLEVVAAEALAYRAAGQRRREGAVAAAALPTWVNGRHGGRRILRGGDIDLVDVHVVDRQM